MTTPAAAPGSPTHAARGLNIIIVQLEVAEPSAVLAVSTTVAQVSRVESLVAELFDAFTPAELFAAAERGDNACRVTLPIFGDVLLFEDEHGLVGVLREFELETFLSGALHVVAKRRIDGAAIARAREGKASA